MATLLELSNIESDSFLNPADFAGDSTRQSEVQAAVDLRQRIRAALWKRALEIVDGSLLGGIGVNDQRRTAARGWAQQVIRSDSSVVMGAMRLLLAQNAGATRAQILGVTDTAMTNAIDVDIVMALAEGSMPGR
jgi:hypothetical protein